jgi:hypothetical protein
MSSLDASTKQNQQKYPIQGDIKYEYPIVNYFEYPTPDNFEYPIPDEFKNMREIKSNLLDEYDDDDDEYEKMTNEDEFENLEGGTPLFIKYKPDNEYADIAYFIGYTKSDTTFTIYLYDLSRSRGKYFINLKLPFDNNKIITIYKNKNEKFIPKGGKKKSKRRKTKRRKTKRRKTKRRKTKRRR